MPLAITILDLLVRYGPDVAQAAQRMVTSGKQPTQADWDALFDKTRKPYDQFVREAEARANH